MRNIQLIAFALFFLCAGNLYAQATCETVISFKWTRKEGPNVTPVAPLSVEVKRLSVTEADETAVKARLAELVPAEKNKAMDSCRREHESLADCLSAKYAAKASVLSSLRFESRKAFEDAIHSDCSAQQGVCLEVLSSDPQCLTKTEGEGEGETAGEGKGKAKEKEGAKEKKKK